MTTESEKDFPPGARGYVERWLEEIRIAEKWLCNWWDKADQVITRYADEQAGHGTNMNVLWANTEILRAAMYGQRPRPDVRRRQMRPDPAGKTAALALERSLDYLWDTQPDPVDLQIDSLLTDYLLTGAGCLRVRYTPTFVKRLDPVLKQGDDKNPLYFGSDLEEVDTEDVLETDDGYAREVEELQFERADLEHVFFRDIIYTPARAWRDVRWVAFRHRFTRDELIAAFGPTKASRVTLAEWEQKTATYEKLPQMWKRAEVWEIWDKAERKVIFLSKGLLEAPLAEFNDCYGLREFFPTPEPLRSVRRTDTMLPVPEYCMYQDQARELDDVTARIDALVAQVKVAGFYDASVGQIPDVMRAENKLIPIENWASLVERGGIDGAVSWVPIEQAVKAVAVLYQQRDALLNTIYQIIGISDIARGASDPRETATAQHIKGQYGSLRLQPRQRALQCYLRDCMRLQAELIAEKFAPETIIQASAVMLDDESMMLLRADALRRFSVDIETDSTIATDDAQDKAQVIEMFGALAQFTSSAAPLLQSGMVPPEAVKEMVLFGLRKFKAGREIEEAFEEPAQPQQQQPDADPIGAAKVQVEQYRAETERMKLELERIIETAKLDQKSAEALLKAEANQRAAQQAALQGAIDG